jgi:curved DNA-binding protein CbpA
MDLRAERPVKLDPYKELNVPRDADAAAIRKAYRDRSKETHPDSGGSATSFALTKLAHDVLTNSKRRERYDNTGDIAEEQVDTSIAIALQNLSGVLDETLQDLIEKGLNPVQYDLRVMMIAKLQAKISKTTQQIAQVNNGVAVYETLLGRWKKKHKDSIERMESLILGKMGLLKDNIQRLENSIKGLEDAIKLLEKEFFTKDDPMATAMRVMWNTI